MKTIKHEKPEWHSRLWEGCPIMINPNDASICIHTWWNGCDNFRLPTIEESPRNTWLLHDGGGCPEGADLEYVYVWLKGNNMPEQFWDLGKDFSWCGVDKFMIIDKEAFN